MQHLLFNHPGLEVRAGSVFDLIFEPPESGHQWGQIAGIKLGEQQFLFGKFRTFFHGITDSGRVFSCSQVIICTGTFLSGEIHLGQQKKIPISFYAYIRLAFYQE
jgi:tRNA uridine 5-carboxymethylaminomethyl modification enzyme